MMIKQDGHVGENRRFTFKICGTSSVHQYLTKFAKAYLLMTILGIALVNVAMRFIDFEPGSSWSIGILIGATSWVAQAVGRDEKRVPEKAESWRFAILSLPIAFAISLIVFGALEIVLRSMGPESLFTDLPKAPVWIWLIAFVFAALVHILFVRFSFPYFAKSTLKIAEKAAAKRK